MKKYQEDLAPKLKKLPIANLETTLNRVLEWSKPVLTPKEFYEFEQIVVKFSQKEGPILQEALSKFMFETEGSWLADFWEGSYLEGRGPIQSETNFALLINPTYHEAIKEIDVKAGGVIYQLTKIYTSLVDGTFPLEQTKSGDYLDMSFYANFFKSIRLPNETKDNFYRGVADARNNFILILKKGHYFKLKVTDETGAVIPLTDLIAAIRTILRLPLAETGNQQKIHALSAVAREKSFELHRELTKEKQNQANLNWLAEALFIVSFNEFSDESETETIEELLLNPENQFFTKTMQVIFTKNGSVGFNFEHAAIDGVPTLNILNKAFQELIKVSSISSNNEKTTGMSSELFSKLEWKISPALGAAINAAVIEAETERSQFAIKHSVFEPFGKDAIKKAGVSPDAFFHVALAMAQYEVSQTFRSIYEPVAMRAYYQGRTESARSMSSEKRTFVEAFFSSEQHLESEQLKVLFTEATSAHVGRITLCQSGKGVERHLFGLQKIAERQTGEISATDYFFSSEGMKLLQEDLISTTGIPHELVESFSFTPVKQDGFGLYYGILANQIILDISSKVEKEGAARELLEALNSNLILLGQLVGIVGEET